MVHRYEQILQENQQRVRELAEPSPVMASALNQVADVQRSQERARSLGFVFPDEFRIPGVTR